MELFAWVGSVCFAICAIPQAWMCYKNGHAQGISNAFLWAWLGGEINYLIYFTWKFDIPLILNYVFNLATLGIILYYKIRPRT